MTTLPAGGTVISDAVTVEVSPFAGWMIGPYLPEEPRQRPAIGWPYNPAISRPIPGIGLTRATALSASAPARHEIYGSTLGALGGADARLVDVDILRDPEHPSRLLRDC